MEYKGHPSENSKHHVSENTSDNTSNQDSKSNDPKKRKNIKHIFHKIFQPGNSIQIQIKNMKLTEIPTQQTRIYVQAKVGHFKSGVKSSSRVKISENNSVQWEDNMTLNYKLPFNSKEQKILRRSLSEDFLPSTINNDSYNFANDDSKIKNHVINKSKTSKHHINNHKHKKNASPNGIIKIRPHLGHEKDKLTTEKHSIKPYHIRFSFRLEDNSGRGHTRYGIAYFNLKKMQVLANIQFKTTLKYCKYNTVFSCNISIKSNRRSSCGYITPKHLLTQDRETYYETSYSESSSGEKHSNKSNISGKNDLLEKNADGNNESHHGWALLPSLADQYTDTGELPFDVQAQKLNFLSQQIEDILRCAMKDTN